jgi:protein-disulfide isomerase
MAKRQSRGKSATQNTGNKDSSKQIGRSRTRGRREERDRERQRRRQMAIVIGVIAVAVIGAALFFFISQPAEAPIPEEALARYNALPQIHDEDGFPTLGNLDAPVQLVEYSSFSCPHCAEFHDIASDTLLNLVQEGYISFTYIPNLEFGVNTIPNAEGATRAALCAGEQGMFWEYHDALFEWQQTFGTRAFTQNRLETGVENLGLNVNQYNRCFNSNPTDDLINLANERNNDNEIALLGTPAIFINGTHFPDHANLEALIAEIQAQAAATNRPLSPVGGNVEATEEADQVETTPEVTEEPETTPEATSEASS